MREILKSLWEHKFIAATGVSALIHSTWAIGTLFAGLQPAAPLELVGWLVPAFLIAFALDMGQIATSSEIRRDGLTLSRGLTFVVFAVATYYCQWIYMVHHMPALPIAPGVSEIAKSTAIYMRDAALWGLPALLPLSTLLYTFSNKKAESKPASDAPQIEIHPVEVEREPQIPFGNAVLTLDAHADMPTMPKSKKRTAIASSTNGHRKETALRNKEVQNGD